MVNPYDNFTAGFNIGNRPNALGTAIKMALQKWDETKATEEAMRQKVAMLQWEQREITGPAESAKFEREKGWEREKLRLEHQYKLAEATASPTEQAQREKARIELKIFKGEPLTREETEGANRLIALKGGRNLVYNEPITPKPVYPTPKVSFMGEIGKAFKERPLGPITPPFMRNIGKKSSPQRYNTNIDIETQELIDEYETTQDPERLQEIEDELTERGVNFQ